MGKPLKLYIQSLRKAKKKRRQLACVVTALSVFVSGGVFWQLRGIGTAMVDKNLPTADDSGGDDPVTLLSSAELETPDIWEATLPPLTDIAGENVARIAESQLGYTESSVNFVHAEDGETHNGYTRYGAWYDSPYGDWNTMFTYFCMDYAGVAPDDIPYGSGCWAWSLELDKAELIAPVTRGSPQRGDILLMDSDADGKADRSCIVRIADDDELIVIEGDIDGSVAECTYFPSDERFIGMVSLDGITADPPVIPAEPAQLDFTAESESGIRVEARADWGAFPFDTMMSVSDISRDEAIQTAAEQLGEDAENVDAVAVDITFTAPDGSELEPAEDSQVSVSIMLPDEQALSDGEFTLLHVTDDGDVHEVADADVSADGADFVAESFSVYVLTSNSSTPINGLIMENGSVGNNSASNPYIVYLGETFVVSYQGEYLNDGMFTVKDNGTNESPFIERIRDVSPMVDNGDYIVNDYRMAKFRGKNEGLCKIVMLKSKNWNDESNDYLWVRVVSPNIGDIYVNTAIGERSKDCVHEQLSDLHSWAGDGYFIFENGERKYIKNGDWYYNGVNQDGGFMPYHASIGDVIELVAYCDAPLNDRLDFFVAERGHHTDTSALEKVGETTQTLMQSGEHSGKYRMSARFRVLKGDEALTGVQFGNDYFYIATAEDNKMMSHADIEIDDGGKYVFEEYSFDSDGNLVKTIKVYDAIVSNINYCKIFDEYGAPLKFKESSAPDISHEGQNVEFVSTDYIKNNVQGESQYELTSNYVDVSKYPNEVMYGFYNLRGNKNFLLKDAFRADFNVDLMLTPSSKTIQTYSSSGELIDTQTPPVDPNQKIPAKKLDFTLDRQAILDAYNKCPVHTGLDFTLAADAVMLDFSMKKDFVGGDISQKSFTFKLYDENNTEVATATSDTNGIVKFENIYFNKVGTFNYTVKEVNDGSTDIIFADDRPVTIIVTNDNGLLKANIDTSALTNKLINYKTYTLPSTGGTGTTPYIIIGTAMLSGALILLYRRRKKEVPH